MSKRPGPEWSIEEIAVGFKRFLKDNNRLPTSQEVDKLKYLPSSRQIQRLFGGLPQLRKLIGYNDVYFSKGKHRSKIGFESNRRSRISENKLRDILYKKFHEPFVHQEKPIDIERKLRADFYVFNPQQNFSVDIFVTETFINLGTNVYIKLQKYSHLKEKMYLVLFSEKLTEEDVALLIERKKSRFPENIELITFDNFIKKISSIPAYSDPTLKDNRG